MNMPGIGLEPTHPAAPEPKSGVSTNFTIRAESSVYTNVYNLCKLSLTKSK